ncbi:type II toxin-antitoxin system RelE/ParE family toxin [Nanoarchaeota archaeon]
MLKLQFSSKTEKFLKKCDNVLSKRIIDKIQQLEKDPVPHDSKRVVNEESTFRIRIGNYRVLYKIKYNEKVILISKIDKRPSVYN